MSSKSEANGNESLNDVCARLSIGEDTAHIAEELLIKFQATPAYSSHKEHANLWVVCALYIASLKNAETKTFSLSHMLELKLTRLYDFFAPLRVFVEALHMDITTCENLEYKYLVLTILFAKYEELFGHLFNNRDNERGGVREKMFRFGWLLFLLARGKLLPPPGDFVRSLHLLICCVNILLLHAPDANRSFPLREILQFVREKTRETSDSLYYLCHITSANYEQVKKLQEDLFNVFLTSLHERKTIRYLRAKVPTDPYLVGTFFLGGLLDTHLNENEKGLGDEYEIMLYESCDFNERLFMEHNFQLQSPKQASQHITRTPAPNTPSKALLTVDDWLTKTFSKMSPDPPPGIKAFAAQHEADAVVDSLNARVDVLLGYPKFPAELDVSRKQLAKKLFYRTLEALLITESKRLKRTDFKPLLTNENFVKSLLACSLEIILSSYRISPNITKFPWILTVFELAPFEFYTIIESLVMNQPEPKLPRPLVKHLIRVEERILEELAWVEHSAVFGALSSLLVHQQPLQHFVDQLNSIMCSSTSTGGSSGVSKVVIGTPKRNSIGIQVFSSPAKFPLFPHVPPSPATLASATQKAANGLDQKHEIPEAGGTSIIANNNTSASTTISTTTTSNTTTTTSTTTTTTTTSSPADISHNKNQERLAKKAEVFIRKVAYMVSLRIHELCAPINTIALTTYHSSNNNSNSITNIPEKVLNQVGMVMSHILVHKPEMLCNRHIDQLLLATFYGVCKVNQLTISFKDIINKYMQQPQANTQTYYKVKVNENEAKKFKLTLGSLPASHPLTPQSSHVNTDNNTTTTDTSTNAPLPHPPSPNSTTSTTNTARAPSPLLPFVDIIKFYNTVFLDAMETFLCDLGSKDQHATDKDPNHHFYPSFDSEGNLGKYPLSSSPSPPPPPHLLTDLRTASPFNLRVHKSPQKIKNLTVSPRRTPLLLREKYNTKSVILGTPGASPRREFSHINNWLNTPNRNSGIIGMMSPTSAAAASSQNTNPNIANRPGVRVVKRQLSFGPDGPAAAPAIPIGAPQLAVPVPALPTQAAPTNANVTPSPPSPMEIEPEGGEIEVPKKGVKRPREQGPAEPNKKSK